ERRRLRAGDREQQDGPADPGRRQARADRRELTVPILAMEEGRLRVGALKVTDNLNVQLDEGEAVGVVGPNGAGKTTMLNLLAGQLRPDSGRIRFDGQDVTAMGCR